MNPEFACSIDWGIFAAWVGALATVGLVLAAFFGYKIWKKQFFKQRDHDLAVTVLRTVNNAFVKLNELRHPMALIPDRDILVAPAEFEDPQFDHLYRLMQARYRARTLHLSDAIEKRTAAMNEALVLWDDYGVELEFLISRLGNKEGEVSKQAAIYVNGLAPGQVANGENPDLDILYASTDVADPDQFADEYEEIIEVIREHLKPKIRME